MFGEELGPVPTPDDEDWLVESTKALRALIVDAYKADKTVMFAFM